MHLLFWMSALTVGLSERGLNLGNFTCSLIALCYVLCRELVIGFWSLETETNLKWMNIYWSCAPPILNVRLDCRSAWEGSELACLTCSRTAKCHVLCREFLLRLLLSSSSSSSSTGLPSSLNSPVYSAHPVYSVHPVHVLFFIFR